MSTHTNLKLGKRGTLLMCASLAAAILIVTSPIDGARAEPDQTTFASPEDAVTALLDSLKNRDVDGLATLFGKEQWEALVGPDKIQAREGLEQIYEAAQAMHTLATGEGESKILVIGAQAWPFPMPLVSDNGKWRFDTEAGMQEILNRRIGQDELTAIAILREYLDAQVRYAGTDRDGDEVLEYSQQIASTPGKKNGLYWESQGSEEQSPLGSFVAESASYLEGRQLGDPFKGYYFKVLTRQGEAAPGGRYDYVINGNMIGGFAMVAFPAEYGNSGIMSFIVSQQGVVLERDLGEDTVVIAQAIDEYDPSGWSAVKD